MNVIEVLSEAPMTQQEIDFHRDIVPTIKEPGKIAKVGDNWIVRYDQEIIDEFPELRKKGGREIFPSEKEAKEALDKWYKEWQLNAHARKTAEFRRGNIEKPSLRSHSKIKRIQDIRLAEVDLKGEEPRLSLEVKYQSRRGGVWWGTDKIEGNCKEVWEKLQNIVENDIIDEDNKEEWKNRIDYAKKKAVAIINPAKNFMNNKAGAILKATSRGLGGTIVTAGGVITVIYTYWDNVSSFLYTYFTIDASSDAEAKYYDAVAFAYLAIALAEIYAIVKAWQLLAVRRTFRLQKENIIDQVDAARYPNFWDKVKPEVRKFFRRSTSWLVRNTMLYTSLALFNVYLLDDAAKLIKDLFVNTTRATGRKFGVSEMPEVESNFSDWSTKPDTATEIQSLLTGSDNPDVQDGITPDRIKELQRELQGLDVQVK